MISYLKKPYLWSFKLRGSKNYYYFLDMDFYRVGRVYDITNGYLLNRNIFWYMEHHEVTVYEWWNLTKKKVKYLSSGRKEIISVPEVKWAISERFYIRQGTLPKGECYVYSDASPKYSGILDSKIIDNIRG